MDVYEISGNNYIFIGSYVTSGNYILVNNVYELDIVARAYDNRHLVIVLSPDGVIRSFDGSFTPSSKSRRRGHYPVGSEMIYIINDLRGMRPYMKSIPELVNFRTVLAQYNLYMDNELGEFSYNIALTNKKSNIVSITHRVVDRVTSGYVDAIIDHPVILDEYMSIHPRADKVILMDIMSEIMVEDRTGTYVIKLPRIDLSGKVLSLRPDDTIMISDIRNPVEGRRLNIHINKDLRRHDAINFNIEHML